MVGVKVKEMGLRWEDNAVQILPVLQEFRSKGERHMVLGRSEVTTGALTMSCALMGVVQGRGAACWSNGLE